jgi:hypothetical protein
MQRNDRPCAVAQEFGRNLSILRRNKNFSGEVVRLDAKLGQWTRELHGSVFGRCEFPRTENQIFYSAPAEIRLKDAIRIVKIAHDQIEAGEIIREVRRQFRIFREKTGEWPVLDGTDSFRITAVLGEPDDMFVAEDFQVHAGIRLAKRTQGRQRQNKIADRAAADNENAVQFNIA